MLKSLGYKAEAFKRYYSASSRWDLDQVREVCFDIQVQLVKFFTIAVKFMRGEENEIQHCRNWQLKSNHTVKLMKYSAKRDGRDHRHGQEDPWSLLQREFINTNQALFETLARIENPVSAPSPSPDQTSSSDMAKITQQVSFLKLPTKIYSSFFNRVDIFEKIDQVFGRKGSITSFRSVALFGLGGVGKSSIAARYIERKFEEKEYDAMFWVYGETRASLRQSFTDIALRLKLPGAQPNLQDENLIQVQNWFQTTGKPPTFGFVELV